MSNVNAQVQVAQPSSFRNLTLKTVQMFAITAQCSRHFVLLGSRSGGATQILNGAAQLSRHLVPGGMTKLMW